MTNAAGMREFELPLARTDSHPLPPANELFLLREMNHRFANTLTLLMAQLRCESRSFAPEQFRDLLARHEARIVAFSKLHRSLMIGVASTSVSVQGYVEHLCRSLSVAILEPIGVRCEVTVDTGALPGARCELLGLVISELVMNAAKHAFQKHDDGVVRVRLVLKDQSWICIVSDNGAVTSPTPQGAGTKITAQLTRMLGGSFLKKSGCHGTSVVVVVPLELP